MDTLKKTFHEIFFKSSSQMAEVDSDTVDLVVTSPPYPMIQMWDELFVQQDGRIEADLKKGNAMAAYHRMHQLLEPVWKELYRVIKTGGFACINIGDATRTVDGHFQLFTNHSRIIQTMQQIGFCSLPAILWRKPTNSPNKFMGSGMLPAGAYVTLEHEYILIFRKGNKREISSAHERALRQESAYFWEERNIWFSDVWTGMIGTQQKIHNAKTRDRSAAFPFELAYRLINMYSLKGDLVLDPFLGSGTTLCAAMAGGRNSVGYEIDTGLKKLIDENIHHIVVQANDRIHQRLRDHEAFVKDRFQSKGPFIHQNTVYGFPVVTKQETRLFFNDLKSVAKLKKGCYQILYDTFPQQKFISNWQDYFKKAEKKNGKGNGR